MKYEYTDQYQHYQSARIYGAIKCSVLSRNMQFEVEVVLLGQVLLSNSNTSSIAVTGGFTRRLNH